MPKRVIQRIITGKQKNKTIIVFNKDCRIIIPTSQIQKMQLSQGMTVSDKLFQSLSSRETEEQGYQYALSLLARKDYFQNKLVDKLEKKYPELNKSQIKAILTKLKKVNLIDDTAIAYRYASSLLRRKNVGRWYLIEKLKKHQVPTDKAKIALKKLSQEGKLKPAHKAAKAAEEKLKRFRSFSPTAKNLAKIASFLRRRGFEFAIIMETVNNIKEKYQ